MASPALFNELRGFLTEIGAEKTAAAKKADAAADPGGYQGASSHATAKQTGSEANLQSPTEGARSSENEADVKATIPINVNSTSGNTGTQDQVQLGQGVKAKETGQDVPTVKGNKEDPGTSTPITTEDGEKYGGYAMLGEQFVARVMRPVWAAFVKACLLSGAVRMPAGWTLRELTAAVYIRPQMPWIDPLKEALARGEMEDRGWQAPQQNIQLIGNDPEEVLRLREDWAQQNAGLATPAGTRPQPDPEDDPNARGRRRAALVAIALQES